MSARARSVIDAAYSRSEDNDLPNAVSAVVEMTQLFGAPSSGPEYFWAVVDWWIKFGAKQFGGSVKRLIACLPAGRLTSARFSVALPSGKVLSIPTALSLINPPDHGDAASKAAHTIMYSVIDFDLFDLCFKDHVLVTDVILDFDAVLEWLGAQPQKPALVGLLARFIAELVIRRPDGIDVEDAERSFHAWLTGRSEQIDSKSLDVAIRIASEAHRKTGPRNTPPTAAAEHRNDIDIYGYFALPIGLGEDARLAATALELAGYRVNRIVLDDLGELAAPSAEVALWAVPAPNLAARALRLTDAHDRQLKIIASPWELARTPKSVAWVYDGMDAVCVYSSFVGKSLPSRYRQRAIKIPMAFDVEALSSVASAVEKADIFTFVVMFDFASRIRRKGPHHAIAAFKLAFVLDEPVRLIIKSTNADHWARGRLHLRDLVAGDPRITLIDANWNSDAVRRLLAEAHTFVSLHASEGFGRILAESMLLNTLVIATDYSGSQEVCNARTALLVPYTLVELHPDDYPLGEGQRWALPDIDAAAAAMRDAFANWHSPRLVAIRQQGRAHVSTHFSLKQLSVALHHVVETTKRKIAD